MSSSSDISATRVLGLLKQNPEFVRCIDVRSNGEFLQGNIPNFANLPILSNQERHEVGICYKEKGQVAAVALGHELVDPHRELLVAAWKNYLQKSEHAYFCCWRGGLRSRIALQWSQEAGVEARQVVGGYKSLRRELLKNFENLPRLFVVAGSTGSGKTKLIRVAKQPCLDLEKLAEHRGSAFGSFHGIQPAQASFENAIGLQLYLEANDACLVEDESISIGTLHLPTPLWKKMRESELILIQESVENRTDAIFQEYVKEELNRGTLSLDLELKFLSALSKIESRLGGLLASQIRRTMQNAFLTQEPDLHRTWIRDLLEHYYDKAYAYSLQKTQRKITFAGDWNECQFWIQKQFA